MKKDTFYDQYPLVFPKREPEQGFHCGEGWYQLLDCLFEVMQKNLVKQPEPIDFRITYIKEKFGTLRVGCEHATDYIRETVIQAEEMSGHICETCGEYGKIRNSAHWIKVRCDSCERTHFAHRNTPLLSEAKASLDAGIKSAQEHPAISLGSFAKFADDEE
ncbi:hypothetical protein M0R72_02805 [Candidatus Pacearchaeota archaeon]|jgi:hypothetical protein|nr:hypothetical protein [Candidatus Pacearchaeota archaeon]